ncbi:MAG TPA: ribosome biogenesis GTP-binding protein YihA/YsxC [Woeseiaceae bacterium]
MSQYSHARFLSSAAELAQFPRDTGVEVAFAGRSNAGKSSAINAILGRRGLARTSRTPGRTQLVNFFVLGEGRRLVDLPGYGYARVSEAMRRRWGELLTRYFRERRSLAGLFLIIDVRRRLTDHDRRMLAFAADCGLGVEILLTKADKLSRAEAARALARVAGEVGEGAGVVLFSAVDGKGVEEGREALERMLARWTERPAAGQKKIPDLRGPG